MVTPSAAPGIQFPGTEMALLLSGCHAVPCRPEPCRNQSRLSPSQHRNRAKLRGLKGAGGRQRFAGGKGGCSANSQKPKFTLRAVPRCSHPCQRKGETQGDAGKLIPPPASPLLTPTPTPTFPAPLTPGPSEGSLNAGLAASPSRLPGVQEDKH